MASFQTYTQSNPTPSAPQPGFFAGIKNSIGNAFNSGISQFKQGLTAQPSANPLTELGNTLKMGSGLATAVTSPISGPLGDFANQNAVQPIANSISDNPSVQNFAMSGAGQATANVAEGVANAANIFGTVAGGDAAAGKVNELFTDNPIFKAGNSALDTATTTRETAAQQGVGAINDITSTLSDFKGDLGHSFQEGAANIEKSNPDLKVTLPHDVIDSLNELKDTKKFQLPDYLRKTNPEFGSSDVNDIQKSGISLGPVNAQDLVTRLNKLTYDAKASGDLAVNQQTVGLANQIKDLTHGTFGDSWSKIYKQYSEGKGALDNFKNIVDLRKQGNPVVLNQSLESIKKLSGTPEGKIILKNAVQEFKNISGYDLTNPTETIGKILDSEETLKEANKPGFLKQISNPVYLGKLGVRLAIYSTLGYWLRNTIKSAGQ